MNLKQFSEALGVNEKTLGTYARAASIPSWEFMIAAYNYGFSLEYILTGNGEMYRATSSTHQHIVNHGKGAAVVGINHGNVVAEVGHSYKTRDGIAADTICEFVQWFANNKQPDDLVWLEKHLERTVAEFAEWKNRG